MTRQYTTGNASISFETPVFIQSCASIVSQKEGEGPLGSCFDSVSSDPLFGTDTWEAAESTLQKKAATLAMEKAGLDSSQIRLLFAGDLLAQTVASSFGTADLGIPFMGCSEPARPWESPCLWQPCAPQPVTDNISSVQPPVISQVRKKNFGFLWDMEIKGPYLLPGLSQVPEPAYLGATLPPVLFPAN